MSKPTEIKNPIDPYVPETTPTIERANRLMSLKQNVGFPELVRISQELAMQVVRSALQFQGWDLMRIAMMKTAAQAAQEHHDALLATIDACIEQGVLEAEEKMAAAQYQKTPEEVVEQSDRVRRQVLERFSQMDQERDADPARIAGSY